MPPRMPRRRAFVRPAVEQLEVRLAPAGVAFHFTLNDPGQQFAPYPQFLADVNAAGQILASVLSGHANLEVSVVPDNSIARAGSEVAQVTPLGTDADGNTLVENCTTTYLRTGVDPNTSGPDITLHINTATYLPTVFFDPSGAARSAPIPSSKLDFISVVTHELVHSLGFEGYRQTDGPAYGTFPGHTKTTFDSHSVLGAGGNPSVMYFTGAHAVALYGGPVPLTTVGPGQPLSSQNFDHVGNPAGGPGGELIGDLMNGMQFLTGTRYTVSALDLAFLADLGVATDPGGQPSSPATAARPASASSEIVVTGADAGGGPQVQVLDATTRAVKLSFFAYSPNFTGGVRVAAGDVNGDGVPDIICAAGPGGGPDVRVFDGRSGALLRQFFAFSPSFTGGVWVAAGDVNGDGFADILCGADAGGGPNITAYSGKDGSRLLSLFAYDPHFTGGVRVAAGDVNGDGFSDIICGAGPGGGPNVTAYSGRDGSLLLSFFAFDPSYMLGIFVGAGDVNGDGHADVVAGAGAGGGPGVAVFDGRNAALLENFFAFDAGFTGGVREAAADWDGDGKADVIAVAGPGGTPEVHVYHDATPARIDAFFAYNPLFRGGLFIGST